MRVLVVGAGRVGVRVVAQLRKNTRVEIVTLDPRDSPPAVREGVIERVDYKTPLDIVEIVKVIVEVAPDLVLLTTSAADMGTTGSSGLDIFLDALNQELEASVRVPVIAVARSFT